MIFGTCSGENIKMEIKQTTDIIGSHDWILTVSFRHNHMISIDGVCYHNCPFEHEIFLRLLNILCASCLKYFWISNWLKEKIWTFGRIWNLVLFPVFVYTMLSLFSNIMWCQKKYYFFLEHLSLRVMMIFLFAWSHISFAAEQKKSPTVGDLNFLKLLSGWFLR